MGNGLPEAGVEMAPSARVNAEPVSASLDADESLRTRSSPAVSSSKGDVEFDWSKLQTPTCFDIWYLRGPKMV